MTAEPPRPLWRALFRTADRVRRMAPWRWMYEPDLFGVQPAGAEEPVYVGVLGQSGIYYAVLVLDGDLALRQYLAVYSSETDDDNARWMSEIRMSFVSFERHAELDPEDRELVGSLGLRFSGRHAWPSFRFQEPGRFQQLPDREQAMLLHTVLDQLLQVAPRFLDDPTFLGHPDSVGELDRPYLVRVQEGPGWANKYQSPRILPFLWENDQPDEFTTRLFRSLPRRTGRLSIGLEQTEAIVENGMDPPWIVYTLLLVDPSSGMVLGAENMGAEESLARMWAHLPARVAELLRAGGGAPQVLRTADWRLEQALRPVMDAAGLRLERVDRTPALDEAFASLKDHLSKNGDGDASFPAARNTQGRTNPAGHPSTSGEPREPREQGVHEQPGHEQAGHEQGVHDQAGHEQAGHEPTLHEWRRHPQDEPAESFAQWDADTEPPDDLAPGQEFWRRMNASAETDGALPLIDGWADPRDQLDILALAANLPSPSGEQPSLASLAALEVDWRQAFSAVQINSRQPGTILRDVRTFLDLVGSGIELTISQRLPRMTFVKALNERLSSPLAVRLRSPKQQSYPNVIGLFNLLKQAGLLWDTGLGQALPDEKALAEWAQLRPADQYFSLLEAWWCGWLDPPPGRYMNYMWAMTGCIQLYLFLLQVPHAKWAVPPGDQDKLAKSPKLTHVALSGMFGVLDITSSPSPRGGGWTLDQLAMTPWGTALIARLIQYATTEHQQLREQQLGKSPGAAPGGSPGATPPAAGAKPSAASAQASGASASPPGTGAEPPGTDADSPDPAERPVSRLMPVYQPYVPAWRRFLSSVQPPPMMGPDEFFAAFPDLDDEEGEFEDEGDEFEYDFEDEYRDEGRNGASSPYDAQSGAGRRAEQHQRGEQQKRAEQRERAEQPVPVEQLELGGDTWGPQTAPGARPTDRPVHIFKVALGKSWRRMALDAGCTVHELAQTIVRAFDFDFDHLYSVLPGDGKKAESDQAFCHHPAAQKSPRATEMTLDELPVHPRDRFTLLYDYGDQWRFRVQLESVETAPGLEERIVLLDAKGRAPRQYE